MTKTEHDVVVTTTEARQARRVGLIWVLLGSLVLAAVVAVILGAYI